MDKSESELLEEWDLVSSAYDTEQEAEKEINPKAEGSTSNGNDNTIGEAGNLNIDNVKDSEADNTDVTVKAVDADTKQTAETTTVSEKANEVHAATEQSNETDNGDKQNTVIDTISAEVSDTEQISASNIIVDDVESTVDAGAECTNIETCDEKIEVNWSVIATETDKDVASYTEDETGEIIEKDYSHVKKYDADDEKKESETVSSNIDYNSVDNSDDRVVNSSLDSSMEHIQIEQCRGLHVQDVSELTTDLVEQENAAIESSSSDIDIIDENLEESVTSSFVHPLSLSISSSVDTSSILTAPLEGNEVKVEDSSPSQRTESHTESLPSYSESFESCTKSSESFLDRPEYHFDKSRYEDSDENARPQPERSHPHYASNYFFPRVLEAFRNVTRLEWSILGGVMLCLYITIVFNQTNIFAVVEREDVVLQMKQMIDELRQDNRILKDQLLSEVKNEKVFSSVEYQIKELKKENSKLNHMLYGVAKVLEEQTDSQKKFQKREAEYIAPFKKEINKLKEHINILKFDNEELQQQLVRMRYASYSQGGSSDKASKEQKDETKTDETASTEEIALDINSLKKWNELMSLLSKELGLSDNERLSEDKSHSDTNNFRSYWKTFMEEFQGTFKNFKANVTSVISNYKKVNDKAVSEIYKFVKDFFTVEEEYNKKPTAPPGDENPQWKNIGDFVNDLKNKWTNIKDRLYTSDVKNFFRNFRKSGDADTHHDDQNSEKAKAYEYNERKPIHADFESDRKPENVHSNTEDSKWMFKRAELRAELREAEKEDPSVNWFLKRKKDISEENDERVKY